MIGRLNHIGVAAPSIDAAAAVYRDLYGAKDITAPRVLADQGVSVAFVNLPNCQIELKDGKSARRSLDDLIKLYPGTEAAQAGKERLASLK